MQPNARKLSLNINLTANDAGRHFSTQDVLEALKPFGVVTTLKEPKYQLRASQDLLTTIWIRFAVGDATPCFTATDAGDWQGTEINEDRLKYLRDNGVCVEMVFEMPNKASYVPPYFVGPAHEAHESSATFVSSFGFSVDAIVFTKKWKFGEAADTEVCWLRMMLAPCAEVPMHKMNPRGTVDLEAYDASLLGFMHNGQLITHPFYSPDGEFLADPRSYGFVTSHRGSGEDRLELVLDGGDYLSVSERCGDDADCDDEAPTIGRYGSDGYMIALCELELTPVQRPHKERARSNE
jgi:hypothetical protein